MKKLFTLLLATVAMTITSYAQGIGGTLGKPGSTDTVTTTGSGGTFVMAITPGTMSGVSTFKGMKALGAAVSFVKIDSLSGVYLKLQGRNETTGVWADLAATPGDSTYVTLPNATGTRNLTLPRPLTPLLQKQYRLQLICPRASKFTISGDWSAL